ncbi:hypothetical protein AAFN85_26755 [Mucilaginibacter sp. CAU 1740]|uniref:hypothetical protein n=1 Tax=Mucilaginibacter sp. CAU 1740 TaxID=3140365 RepID=UPI00325A4EB4
MQYIYLGDRLTDPVLKGQRCKAVRRADGKCIRGRNGSMLVKFAGNIKCVVIGRQLRKIKA